MATDLQVLPELDLGKCRNLDQDMIIRDEVGILSYYSSFFFFFFLDNLALRLHRQKK